MRDKGKRVLLQDLADALGLSMGTVDRALHNRPGVNPMTRAKVVQMAKTMGYRPNLAARALASKRRMRIAAIMPRDPHGFFSEVADGIREVARAFEGAGVQVELHECPWLKEGEAEVIEAAVDDGVNGLIIAPGSPEAVRSAIRKASRKNIPAVCVSSDAPGTERLTVVLTDPGSCGATAAELLGRVLWGKGGVAVVTGSVEIATHTEILDGFRTALADEFPDMRLCSVVEAHDNAEEAYAKTLDMFAAGAPVAGLYVSTSNSIAVLRALDTLGLTGKVVVVTMDLFPALSHRIQDGAVLASIHQRPHNQGRQAFLALYRFLTEGICPPSQMLFPPHVVMRGNLKGFLRVREEGTVAEVVD
jgi:LacI family transcriptional regulator